jgi:hypothetical protein
MLRIVEQHSWHEPHKGGDKRGGLWSALMATLKIIADQLNLVP